MGRRQDRAAARGLHGHRRIMLWSLLTIVLGAMVLPSLGYLYAALQPAAQAQATSESNARANYWRAVREGVSGYTAVKGQETNVLIQNGGQNWRQIRNGPVANYGGWLLFLVLLLIAVYFAVRGPVKLEGGRSGKWVERWKLWQRTLHWYTAVLFIILAVTGLSLLFGRAVLIPLLGLEGFSGWAAFSKDLHNTLGPAFAVGVVLMIIFWIPMSLPEKWDWDWIRKGGGMLTKSSSHPHAGRVNAGEKYVTFWLGVVVLGLLVTVTGFILDFPNFGQWRDTMQLANVIHASAAVLWMTIIMGHIYLGSVGVEGALEAMTHGRVDENWAKQHHDMWLEEVKKKGEQPAAGSGRSGAAEEQPT